ncbi:hypothetical protein HK405_000803 [Cladochytrium tenue]|nr:hypothetical protein HK405_000803 [Cladochytrium tenue]
MLQRAYIALNHLFYVPEPAQPRSLYRLRSFIASGRSPVDAELVFVHEEMMRLWTPRLFERWVARGTLPTDNYLFAWISSLLVEAVASTDPSSPLSPPPPPPVAASAPGAATSSAGQDAAADSSFLPFRVLLRLLDLMALWGADALHVAALALLKKHEAFLCSLEPSAALQFLLPLPVSPAAAALGASPAAAVYTRRPCWGAASAHASSASSGPAAAASLDDAFVRTVAGLWNDVVAYPSRPVGGATSGRKLSGKAVVARLREVYHNGTVSQQ